jgi:hypothetical protein
VGRLEAWVDLESVGGRCDAFHVHEWLDSINALGTLVAIGTSLFLLRQGQRDRREAANQRKREQASRVTCWAEWNSDWSGGTFAQPRCPSVRVSNASDAAVYEVFVDFIRPADGQTCRADIGAVAPGGSARWDFEESFQLQGWVPDALMPRLYFRDANGVPWKRTARGILVPDPGPYADGPVKQLPRQTSTRRFDAPA